MPLLQIMQGELDALSSLPPRVSSFRSALFAIYDSRHMLWRDTIDGRLENENCLHR
jgi:hypothetical protein